MTVETISDLRRDAARYRFIREKQVFGYVPIIGGWQSEADFDAAIDAMIENEQRGKKS